MHGVSPLRSVLPATTVMRFGRGRPAPVAGDTGGQEAVLAAVIYPPRRQQVSPLGVLLPEVLARYGIEVERPVEERFEAVA